MRISTLSIYGNATSQLNTLQSALARTQMQLSTNRRILTPADDPVASARALEVSQSKAMNEGFASNRASARSSLAAVEGALQNAGNLLQDIQELAVKAGNGSMLPQDREALAIELEGRLDDLLGVANTTDGAGGYLFSGYKATTQPYTRTPTGADYQGDQGQRQLQVGASRKIPLSASGTAVFDANPTGNGAFQTQAGALNTGAAIISSGAVVDRDLVNDDLSYKLTFSVAPGTPPQTTYTVYDTTSGTDVALATHTGIPYEDGKTISFGGLSFDIKGVPANGDVFTAEPSKNKSVFETVTELVAALRAPVDGSTGKAALTNRLNTAIDNLKGAHDNVLTVQASVGAHMKELDYLDSAGDDLDIQYAATLGDLQDLDMVKAISDFSMQQNTLQAAQMSFKTMSGLSLFNYL
ncbi:flagellar hook-associated protein FlgL [Massilia sp. IC2-477]|uniref:flagellar hook-associated protein FlgL n=1 Tax=unclassified Massilia TaxID=2609279 RepID=UPI001D106FA1|nr:MULTISPECIES: flagellar hook-associated protein FlgL [unclassified Massilia]MCC2957015.1 flagellar hook-associated protein FlgL [Massilia sp. IC2-477]MCC2970824.1 flagellar hook-associated protein FlgL [Massilia sp. IC2-476]